MIELPKKLREKVVLNTVHEKTIALTFEIIAAENVSNFLEKARKELKEKLGHADSLEQLQNIVDSVLGAKE